MASSLGNLGLLARREGNSAAAVESFTRAWDLVRRQAQQVSGDEARRAFGSAKARYAADLQQALLARGDRAGALRVLEEGRAQALQQVLAERGLEQLATPEARTAHTAAFNAERIARTAHGRALDRAQQSEALLADAAGKPEAVRAPLQAARDAAAQEAEAARAALVQCRLETETAWARVKATAPRAALADPLPFDRARAALRPGELFLAYSVAEKETTLFLVPGGTATPVTTLTLPLGDQGWQQAISALTDPVRSQFSSEAQVRAGGRSLAARLLPPAALAAVRAARRVIVSPDGRLWNVPFAALVLPRAGREPEQYLGLAKPLVTAQSLSLYARAITATGATGKPALAALTVGGCLFSPAAVAAARAQAGPRVTVARPAGGSPAPGGAVPATVPAGSGGPPPPASAPAGVTVATRGAGDILRGGDTEWPPLPATGAEAAGIARLYGGRALSGLAATETEVRKQFGSAGVIHLATHGRYHNGDALLSGLILTQPGTGEPVTAATDGVLEAAEVLDPALRLQAEVVVLSGCETARGVRTQGEGLVGLTRCWQIAGARSVVASQWRVADDSTAALMAAFHRGLQAGLTKDEAMRKAMGEVAKTKEWAHPFFWAPFLVTGDPRVRKE